MWPGSTPPVRIEAAALRGRPVAFALLGPWDKPDRIPQTDENNWKEGLRAGIYGGLMLAICVASAWLAHRNLTAGGGDRRGALRLAGFIFLVHTALWLTQSHIVLSSILGMFLLALCTSLFYGIILWTVYLALEPYVRRHWPRTLISWSRLVSGQWRDPIGAWPARGPHSLRDGLLFFSLLFLLRVILRNQWLAAVVVLRYRLLPLTTAFCVAGLIGPPLSLHGDAWYFSNVAFLFGSAIALTAWAFYTSVGRGGFRSSGLLA